jgi:hypothetical protein
MVDVTDILAMVFMALLSMRRMDVRATEARAFPLVALPDFDRWKALADGAKSLSINACFAKIALRNVWFLAFRSRVTPPVLFTVERVIFFGWIALLLFGWYRSSKAQREAVRLGIVVGRRLVPAETAEPRSD